MIGDILQEAIRVALEKIGIVTDGLFIALEHPDDMSHGDYSTNIAMVLLRELAKATNSHTWQIVWAQKGIMTNSPRELAEKIRTEIENKKPKEIEKVEVAGPGFINFYLSADFFASETKKVLQAGKKFGANKIGAKKKVIVEYSSPNIAKPFTIGHLRSTIIGDAIANILDFSGYTVIRDNHLGDWGTQFGKLIVAIKKWSSLAEIEKSKQPIKDLVALYVKFHDEAEKDKTLEDEGRMWFAKLETGDKEAQKIWKLCVKLSRKEFDVLYKRLGVKFDTAYGESFFEDKMGTVIRQAEKFGILKDSEGARLVFFDTDKYPPLMLVKSDGSSIYALRDLATDIFRKKKYGKEVMIINEVGSEQGLYFKQIFEVEKMLGYSNGHDRVHVAHGLYRFADGKMSTRKGNVIWLEEILDEAIEKAGEHNKEVAEQVGIGAIKFNDLKRESSQDIVFDWNEILNLKGDSGPYLQYAYARAESILRKAKEAKIKPNFTLKKGMKHEISAFEKMLQRFPEVVARSAQAYAPHYIATYLIELASAYNTFYAQEKIVDTNDTFSPYKVALTEAFSIVLKNGLNLLGIDVVKNM